MRAASNVSRVLAIALSVALAGCSTTPSRSATADGDSLAASMAPYKVRSTARTSGPLGSETNPVRVYMPTGEREYLSRLRCSNGKQPQFERHGSGGFSPHQRIMDLYGVDCGSGAQTVFMDMYHCVEDDAPIPGFEIVPELGSREKDEC